MKNISIIVAIGQDFEIGKDNQLLWHISDDLKRFKRITSNHMVIMGRNTYLSLPKRPLPNRINVVITDNKEEKFEDCVTVYSIEEAIDAAHATDENFIIGGAMVYKQFMAHANKLYLTRVHQNFDADAFFPKINFGEWDLIEQEDYQAGDKCKYPFSYMTYTRKS
ncbi:MAG: hypothetical protein C0594_05520 [Marinilabiliales bacterium]|nr:MAG: hypothetical protein C0594_05520 [Marinilabiliales bacterium]